MLTLDRHVNDCPLVSPLVDDIIHSPLVASQDDGGGGILAVENLYSENVRLLGNTVRLAGNGSRHVSAVAAGVVIQASESRPDECRSPLKLGMRGSHARVDNIRPRLRAGEGIVEIGEVVHRPVRHGAEAPGRTRLGGSDSLDNAMFLAAAALPDFVLVYLAPVDSTLQVTGQDVLVLGIKRLLLGACVPLELPDTVSLNHGDLELALIRSIFW